MSGILKTEAVVLTKIDFGDSSNIVSVYTRELGRISAIVKGGKTGKSGKSKIIDPPNYLLLTIYTKSTREVQLISEAEIISHYPRIRESLDTMKYSYAVLELIKKLVPEHESSQKLFRGVVRILDLLNNESELPPVVFGRFFIFLLKELGYEFQIEKCSSCGRTNAGNSDLSYNFENGIFCGECSEGYLNQQSIDAELFRYLLCLKNNVEQQNPGKEIPVRAINLLERFLMHHIPGFQGIQTFQIFR